MWPLYQSSTMEFRKSHSKLSYAKTDHWGFLIQYCLLELSTAFWTLWWMFSHLFSLTQMWKTLPSSSVQHDQLQGDCGSYNHQEGEMFPIPVLCHSLQVPQDIEPEMFCIQSLFSAAELWTHLICHYTYYSIYRTNSPGFPPNILTWLRVVFMNFWASWQLI